MRPVESAVIAAAGLGSRLGLGIPKCMLEIEGRTLLDRLVETVSPYVKRILLVVGYREEIVIERCQLKHRKVVIVRNPEFRTTNTAHSLALAARSVIGKVVYLDGDLLITKESFDRFMEEAKQHEHLIGFTEPKTEHAVFIQAGAESEGGGIRVESFSRSQRSKYEWANVVAGPADLMKGAEGYVFERLAARLPAAGQRLELAEVDTEEELRAATAFAREHRL